MVDQTKLMTCAHIRTVHAKCSRAFEFLLGSSALEWHLNVAKSKCLSSFQSEPPLLSH